MAYHCVVTNCHNGSYRLKKWKKSNSQHSEEPPFTLWPIPTQKEPEKRAIWLRNINRLAPGSKTKLYEPSKDGRVCSVHFKDGYPSEKHPYPTQELGYNFEERSKRFSSTDNTDTVSTSTTHSKRRRTTTAQQHKISTSNQCQHIVPPPSPLQKPVLVIRPASSSTSSPLLQKPAVHLPQRSASTTATLRPSTKQQAYPPSSQQQVYSLFIFTTFLSYSIFIKICR